MDFQCMFYSPLKRAAQTSEIVWGGRSAPAVKLPSLREIDLYSFQASRGL
jgi:broad specificity phosphatase PhoE